MDLSSLSLDFLTEPALAMDADGTVLVANPQARARLGGNILGRSVYAILSEPAVRFARRGCPVSLPRAGRW